MPHSGISILKDEQEFAKRRKGERERGGSGHKVREIASKGNRGSKDPSGNAEGSGMGDRGRAGSQVRSGAGMGSVQRTVTQKTVHAGGELGRNLEGEAVVLESVLQSVAGMDGSCQQR